MKLAFLRNNRYNKNFQGSGLAEVTENDENTNSRKDKKWTPVQLSVFFKVTMVFQTPLSFFLGIVTCSGHWEKIFVAHPNQHICYKTKLRNKVYEVNYIHELWKRTSMLHSCYWSILCLQTLICRFLSDCGVFIPSWFSSLFPNPSKRPAVVNKKVKSVPQHTASTLHWAGMLTCNNNKKKNKGKSFFNSLLVLCSVISKRVIVLLLLRCCTVIFISQSQSTYRHQWKFKAR